MSEASLPEADTVAKVHDHIWDTVSCQPSRPQRPVTVVLLRCVICHMPATATLEGSWTMAQLTGRAP